VTISCVLARNKEYCSAGVAEIMTRRDSLRPGGGLWCQAPIAVCSRGIRRAAAEVFEAGHHYGERVAPEVYS
jgi:hypothetical protein